MSRRKRSSKILEKAERRSAGLHSINEELDLGNGLSVDGFDEAIEATRTRLTDYNKALSTVDKLYTEMLETERKLGDMAEHMLLGVASKYGKNSAEYEMAGGVRKSERKRPARKLTSEVTV